MAGSACSSASGTERSRTNATLMTGVGEAGISVDTGVAASHAASSVTRVTTIVSCRSVCSPLPGLLSVPRYTVVYTCRGEDMHSRYEVERVLSLVAEGWNDCQISRATGINRTTIREWRHRGPPGRRSTEPHVASAARATPRRTGVLVPARALPWGWVHLPGAPDLPASHRPGRAISRADPTGQSARSIESGVATSEGWNRLSGRWMRGDLQLTGTTGRVSFLNMGPAGSTAARSFWSDWQARSSRPIPASCSEV